MNYTWIPSQLFGVAIALSLVLSLGCIPEVPGYDNSNDAELEGLDLPPGQWTWMEVPTSFCGNGSASGVGILPGTDPSQVAVFFAGGGACWNIWSCGNEEFTTHIRTNYDEEVFLRDLEVIEESPILDRDEGPLREATVVFVPYCTGDFHAGDNIMEYYPLTPNDRTYHRGAHNVREYIKSFEEWFPRVSTFYLLGVSAGGYGAMLNFERFSTAFPDADVHVLADSAQMVDPQGERYREWTENWKLEFPEGCDRCDRSFSEYAKYLIETYDEGRFALLAYDRDLAIRLFFGHSAAELQTATQSLIDDAYDYENGSVFLSLGNDHVMLNKYEDSSFRDVNGVSLKNFFDAWVEGR